MRVSGQLFVLLPRWVIHPRQYHYHRRGFAGTLTAADVRDHCVREGQSMGEYADINGRIEMRIDTDSLAKLMNHASSSLRADLVAELNDGAVSRFLECGGRVNTSDDGTNIVLDIAGDYQSNSTVDWLRHLAAAGATGTLDGQNLAGHWRWVLAEGVVTQHHPSLVYSSAPVPDWQFCWQAADLTGHPTLLAVVDRSTGMPVAWTFDPTIAERVVAVLCADA